MIRHPLGSDFLLIAQHDHALLSGIFATHLGGGPVSPPSRSAQTIEGISLHDSGWPLHDDEPTLSEQGLPLHVLESPMSIAVRVWSESARRAAEKGPYAGLLVSLHVLALSSIAKTDDPTPHERYRNAQDLFELNKFQHRQIELQEGLRRRLGMRTDLPLLQGLSRPGVDPAEDELLFNYNLLKAMDRLSLDVCSDGSLFESVEGVYPRPGAEPITLAVGHPEDCVLTVRPWPFDVGRIELDAPCRRVPAKAYADEVEFRHHYAAAPKEAMKIRLLPEKG